MVDDRRAFRLALAKEEAPRALLTIAIVVAVLSVINLFLVGRGVTAADVLHAVVVLAFLGASWLARQTWVPPAAVPWIVAASAVVIVVSIEYEVWVDPTPQGIAYILIAMVAYGAFTLSVAAMVTAAVPMTVLFVLALAEADVELMANWLAIAVAALAMGFVLLRVRLRGIDALHDLTVENMALATRDPLTGAYNRRGIEERVPELMAMARRQGQPAFVMFIDVDGLKAANDTFGHDIGDTVLVAVAEAVRGTVREADLVGRWGGDEFIVVGLGDPLPPDELEARLLQRFVDSGLDLTQWPGTVSTGSATSRDADAPFLDLVVEADASMYARRAQRRSE